jgi:hypothetical protein
MHAVSAFYLVITLNSAADSGHFQIFASILVIQPIFRPLGNLMLASCLAWSA